MSHETSAPPDQSPGMTRPPALRRVLESTRYLAAIGSVIALVVCAATFAWAGGKAVQFFAAVTSRTGPREDALVYLFESIDTILAGVVLLQVGLGLWELCVGDLALPESLATRTFDELEAKVAGTLVLVLVVRFLEELVQDPEPQQLLATGIAVTLVGGLLVLFMRWRH